MDEDKSLWSLTEIFELMPVGEDSGTVEDSLRSAGFLPDARVWRLERLHLRRDVNDTQLHDDQNDLVGLKKIAALAQALAEGATLPPMIGERGPGTDSPVLLHDGRHRYNAYLLADVIWAPVWVAQG